MQDDNLVERYAAALYGLCGAEHPAADMDRELTRACALLTQDARLMRALEAPTVAVPVKRDIVGRVLGSELSPLAMNFLYILVNHQRMAALASIGRRFHEMLEESQGEVAVEVEVAFELPPGVRQAVIDRLSAHTGRRALVKWTMNPDILGGITVRIQDRLIDYSLRGQLNELKDRLLEGVPS